jgi:RNA recognition motif-containing protein
VRNLPFECTYEDLASFFSQAGEVREESVLLGLRGGVLRMSAGLQCKRMCCAVRHSAVSTSLTLWCTVPCCACQVEDIRRQAQQDSGRPQPWCHVQFTGRTCAVTVSKALHS